MKFFEVMLSLFLKYNDIVNRPKQTLGLVINLHILSQYITNYITGEVVF